MEYLKQCLKFCCKRCIDERKDSDASTKIILPPTRRRSSIPGHGGIPLTYTFLAQPHTKDSNANCFLSGPTLQVPTGVRRKFSSPSILTTSHVPIQLRSSYSNLLTDPTIHIEEPYEDNWNNNSGAEMLCRSDSVPAVHTSKMVPMKRLSLAQTYSNHSRRSSMSSFDISKDEVDSDLYDSSEIIPDINSNGKLCFSVNYDKEFEQLSVCVIAAKGLWHHETSNAVTDSFVKVSLLPPFKKKSTKSKSATQRATSNPVYDETFTFDRISFGLQDSIHIKLTVCTFDKSSRKKKLGTIVYKLTQEAAQKQTDLKQWRHLYAPGTTAGNKGNLMLTTAYHPKQGHLHVSVIKASELDLNEQEKTLEGVYVKVALVQNGKVVSKNKTKLNQPATVQPTFDETFVFNMSSNMIDQSCLLVAICGKTVSGKRTHIGYVSLGPPFFATGSGLEQWTMMISMPYSTAGKWHPLHVWSKKESSHPIANECNMF